MTNQEAINLLYDIRNTMSSWKGQEKHVEALTMAIGALSKEKQSSEETRRDFWITRADCYPSRLSHGEIVQLEEEKKGN